MYSKFFTLKTRIISRFNLLTSYLPFKIKAKILLPTLMVAAIAVPVGTIALCHVFQANPSSAIDGAEEVRGVPSSASDMPAPFVDQNFYNCVETEFSNEFPGEPIDPAGLTDAQLAKIETLTCDSMGGPESEKITNATGIEKLTALTYLDVYNERLTILDLSSNTSLTYLNAAFNKLTTLNITNNTALTELRVGSNSLTTLDLSNNTALTYLDVHNNEFATLNVTNNTALTELRVGSNSLTTLDLSNNTALTNLSAYYNQFTTLDLTNNTALTYLDVDDNQLTSLDVSNNTALTNFGVNLNQLTSLDVTNNTALTYLGADSNQLISLDVTNNTALTYLGADNNQLTSLDVSKNTVLTDLSIYGNQLTTLDLSKNTALTYLDVYYNQLASLDVSKNVALRYLGADHNQLTSLDVANNVALTDLRVDDNQLTSLDVANNKALNILYADDIMVKASITGQQVGSNRNFDLTSLRFIGDVGYYANTIPNTTNYTFDESTKLLSVNNLFGADGYAQITATFGGHVTYKLQLPRVYKVQYDLNGGTSSAIPDSECESMDGGCNITLSDTKPTRSGYKFLGWAKSSTAASPEFQPGSKITLSGEETLVVLYAMWEEIGPGPTPPEPIPTPDNPPVPQTGDSTGTPNTGTDTNLGASATLMTVCILLPALAISFFVGQKLTKLF